MEFFPLLPFPAPIRQYPKGGDFLYTGISYGEYLDTPQCRVSIDNVRMKFSYKYRNYDFGTHEAVCTIDLLSERLDNMYFDNCEVNWQQCDFFKIGNYARTCKLSGIDPLHGDWSCAVMFGRYTFDNSCKLVAPEIVFDFNPNKVPHDRYTQVINILKDSCIDVSINRYDVAFDFPIPRDHVTLIPNDRQRYQLIREAETGVTEYQGKRSHHKAMKLYDKMKESALDVPVTRCEITIDGDYVEPVELLFPELVVLGDLQMDMGFADLPFQVVACLLHPELIPILKSKVDYKTWKKYSGMIATHGQRKLAPDNWNRVDQYLSAWFTRLLGGVA